MPASITQRAAADRSRQEDEPFDSVICRPDARVREGFLVRQHAGVRLGQVAVTWSLRGPTRAWLDSPTENGGAAVAGASTPPPPSMRCRRAVPSVTAQIAWVSPREQRRAVRARQEADLIAIGGPSQIAPSTAYPHDRPRIVS